MIGWLRGEVLQRSIDGTILINVNDVGYQLSVPSRTTEQLAAGETAEFFVRTHVRDDAIVLFGFSTPLDRATFDLLLATPGVGPSTALGALSKMTPTQLAVAIAAEDVTLLATIPGIGRKTAARLVLELNGKLPSLEGPTTGTAPRSDPTRDLVAALRQLGYSAAEIREGLADVELPADDEAALRIALRLLGRS